MTGQDSALQAVASIGGSLSFIASAYMVRKYSSDKSKNFLALLLTAFFSLNLVVSAFLTIGRGSFGSEGFCSFQGFAIQWMFVALMLWVMLMSYLMYMWIVKKQHPKRLEKLIRRNLFAILCLGFVISIILLGAGSYAPTGIWCWISRGNPVARFLAFEDFLVGAWLVNIVTLLRVHSSISSRLKRATFHDKISELLNSSRDGNIQTKLMSYLGVFTFVWFFALVNRIVEAITGDTYFPTAFLEALFVPLQGFLYAITYSNLIKRKYCRSASRPSSKLFIKSHGEGSYRVEMVDPTPENMALVPKTSSKAYAPKKYSIFTTTFNMGEAPLQYLQDNIKDWIVEGHDVYAIGLQECMDLAAVRNAILQHLGGPEKYQLYGIAIGSDTKSLGFHGFIALSVFVKSGEIIDGSIQVTVPAKGAMATGADLIITTAQNKGAVGIPLQIHDTSIGFVTCHLPSDSKGKSKLSKRNASAHSILKEVTLAPEDMGFDLHLQHDHVLVFGDLNYRMDTDGDGGGVNSLTGVTVACNVERQSYGDDPKWIHRKYNLLRHSSDPLYPTISEIKLIHAAKNNARGAWKSVLRADELRSIMDDGDAFYGFEEPMPTFPPSYKRRKGQVDADCGDYTNFDVVIKGYSNTGYVENLLQAERRGSSKKHMSAPIALAKGFQSLTGSGKKRSESNAADIRGSLSRSGDETGDNEDGRRARALTPDNADAMASERRSSMDDNMPPEKDDPSKLRPPSYTDRVLVHSLPDRKDRLTIQAYDSVDLVRVSDHRPVSMTILLEVNSKVFYKETAQDAGVDEHASAHEPQFELYELSIADMSVTLIDLMYMGDDDEESERESVAEDTPSTAGRGGMPFSVDKERITSSETVSSSGSLLARNDRLESFSGSNPLHGVRSNSPLRPNSSGNKINGVNSTTTRNASLFPRIDENNDDNNDSNSNQDSNDVSANNSSKKEEAIAAVPSASDIPPPSDASPSSILSSPQREKKKRVGGGLRFAGGDDDVSSTTAAAVTAEPSSKDTAALPPPPPPGALNKEESSESVAISSPGSGSPDHSNPTSERKKKKKVGGIRFSEDTPVVISEETTNNDTSNSANVGSTGNNNNSNLASGGLLSRTTSSSTKVDEDSIEMQSISSAGAQEGVVTVTTIAPAPLPPQSFNRGDLMKKSRSRSFFGGLTKQPSGRRKSIFQSISATLFGEGDEDANGNNNGAILHTESEDDILRDMARDSLNWKNESGDWRKRVLEEERALREKEGNKLLPKNLTTTIKKKKKKFHLQKIDQVTVIFPLPSKDPLLSYRRLFDYADAFNFDKDAKVAGQDLENQLRDDNADAAAREELLKASSVFQWNNRPPSQRVSTGPSAKKESKFDSVDEFKVKGCASSELGAHALIKVTTRAGNELGSSVICVTHLLHRDPQLIRSSIMTEIPLSTGAQKRGYISGTFSLKYIPSALSANHLNNHHHQNNHNHHHNHHHNDNESSVQNHSPRF